LRVLGNIVLIFSVGFLCVGCSQSVLVGRVVNHDGEALPGVSVRVEGTEFSALTNALGDYKIGLPTGDYRLLYAKTGYTVFNQVVRVVEDSSGVASVVSLWNLPSENSVFLFSGVVYTPMSWIVPKRYYMEDGTTDYGTQVDMDAFSDDSMPLVISYRMPRYDARLTRLQEKVAQLPQDDSQTFNIWSSGGTVSVDLVPVVHSDPSLVKLDILEPLQPGRYAVHWGALEGYTTLDERIFMFEITEKAWPDLAVVEAEMDGQEVTHVPHEDEAP
jgi:hypothetical protein